MKRMILMLALFMAASLCGCHDSCISDDNSGVKIPEETAVPAFAGVSGCSRFANDSAVYVEGDSGKIQQWSFDGILQNQFRVLKKTGKMEFSVIFSVENDRLIYGRTNWKTDREEIMQIPIKENEEGQYLDVDHQEKLWEEEIGEIGCGDTSWIPEFFYINEDYIVYLRGRYSKGGMVVYDRREGKKVHIKNLPKKKKKDAEGSRDTIYRFTDAMTSVQSQVCGDRIIFNTEPVGDRRYRAPYGFSVYRLGEDRVETIDERCYTAAAYITDEKRQKVYYQIETDQSIWEYDCGRGEKRELISEQEFRLCYEEAGLEWREDEDDDSMFLQGDTLYIIRAKSDIEDVKILSYDLQGKQGLRYEQKVTQELERWIRIAEWNEGYLPYGDLTIVMGKLILYLEDEGACFCIDLATAEGRQVMRGDQEFIYFLMAAGIQGDLSSDYYEVDEVKRSQDEAARAQREQKRKEREENRRKKLCENGEKAAKLSEKEQLTQLAAKMVQQNRKWVRAGAEGWYSVCYAVTDLDHNGALELILSTGPQGNGAFTTTVVYEAGAEGKAVTLQKLRTGEDIVEITADGNVANSMKTAYRDAGKNIWYYVTQDYSSGGYRQKAYSDCVWKAAPGEWESEEICGYYDSTDHKSQQYKTVYFKQAGEEIQEIRKSEYDAEKIMDERFAHCGKYRVSISWGRMKSQNVLSAGASGIYEKLQESYRGFETKEMP